MQDIPVMRRAGYLQVSECLQHTYTGFLLGSKEKGGDEPTTIFLGILLYVCTCMHKVRIHSYVHVNKYTLGARTCTYKNRYVWYKYHIMHPCYLLYRIQ